MNTLVCDEHHRFGYVWETVGLSMALLLTFPQYENFFLIVHVCEFGCGSGISVVSRAVMLTALQSSVCDFLNHWIIMRGIGLFSRWFPKY